MLSWIIIVLANKSKLTCHPTHTHYSYSMPASHLSISFKILALGGEEVTTNFKIFGVTWLRIEPTTSKTQGNHTLLRPWRQYIILTEIKKVHSFPSMLLSLMEQWILISKFLMWLLGVNPISFSTWGKHRTQPYDHQSGCKKSGDQNCHREFSNFIQIFWVK